MKPSDTLDKAERLYRDAKTEAQFRQAVSRYYFGVFQYLSAHPKIADFTPTGGSDDHRRLIEHLKASEDEKCWMAGTRYLPRLRALRNHADYKLEREFTQGLADEAAEYATAILYDLLPVAVRAK